MDVFVLLLYAFFENLLRTTRIEYQIEKSNHYKHNRSRRISVTTSSLEREEVLVVVVAEKRTTSVNKYDLETSFTVRDAVDDDDSNEDSKNAGR